MKNQNCIDFLYCGIVELDDLIVLMCRSSCWMIGYRAYPGCSPLWLRQMIILLNFHQRHPLGSLNMSKYLPFYVYLFPCLSLLGILLGVCKYIVTCKRYMDIKSLVLGIYFCNVTFVQISRNGFRERLGWYCTEGSGDDTSSLGHSSGSWSIYLRDIPRENTNGV